MANHSSDTHQPSNAIMIGSFVFMAAVLWGFTDALTALVGTILIGVTYANFFSPDKV